MCERSRSGIIKKQILKILRKQYLTLIGIKLSVDEKTEFLKETLLNIFRNYIPNKEVKYHYLQPPWMKEKAGQRKIDRDKIS